ncbi:S1 family peptidase [Microvirga sp. c23x22]|uniref:S1 family peptidase n=2 Tax=Microvirga terricola TaxID=2719797 RepID=A0ABX0VBL9_9HYPH|nr:S1 family peptidase [Microvirga terricola]NIX76893.1 S1 family peptidase [Microvirga terricola]
MKRLAALAIAASLLTTSALAIVGGAEDQSPLARQSVMVLSSHGGVCSAIVIARDVVLTAAHCVTGAPEHRVHFRDEAGQPVLIVPAAKAVHPGYDAKAVETRRRSIDLALIRIPDALPAPFEAATLDASRPMKDETVIVGGYGLAREGDAKTTGTFRAARLKVIEPYGPSTILLWLRGDGPMGACHGDSGGPIAASGAIVAITSWSTAAKGLTCGDMTQGALLGPQRAWIDKTLDGWNRAAKWGDKRGN